MENLGNIRYARTARKFALLSTLATLAALAVVQAPHSRAASTLVVGDDHQSCHGTYPSIQDAVNAASAGDTVQVCAGSYVENVVLSKSVTLDGPQSGVDARGRSAASEATISPVSGTGLTLMTGSLGSVIDGFTFMGNGKGIESTTGPIDGVHITDNRFLVGSGGSGVFLNDNGTDVTVDHNSFDGGGSSSDLMHLDTDGFNGFQFIDNDVLNSGGTGLFSDGNHNVNPSVDRAPALSGNRFSGNDTGANLGRKSWTGADISGNEFAGNHFPGLQGGMQNSTITDNVFQNNGRGGLELTGFGHPTDATRGAQGNTITGNVFTGNGFTNAGEAIFLSSSQAPGTISTNHINDNDISGNAAGIVYTGSETIDASGNWWGDGSGPAAASNPGSGDSVAASVDYTPWLTSGTDTDAANGFQGDFSDLKVSADSPQYGSTGRIQEAVNLVSGSTIHVLPGTYAENVVLSKSVTLDGPQVGVDARGRSAASEATISPVSGTGLTLMTGSLGSVIDGFTFMGNGKGIESTTGPIDGVHITDNRFLVGSGGSGVFLNDNGTDVTVDHNSFDGGNVSSTLMHLDTDGFNGFQFIDNDVLNSGGTGLFSDGNRNVNPNGSRVPELIGNVFKGNETGANLGRRSWSGADISANTFQDNLIGLQGGIASSAISGNTFDGNGLWGLEFTGFGHSDASSGANNNSVVGNEFSGNGNNPGSYASLGPAAVFLSSSQAANSISTNHINDNNISGNAAGIVYSGTETIDGTCNWWGDPNGPSGAGPGGGDSVSSHVDFAPWRIGPAPDGPCIGPLMGTKQNIRDAIAGLLPTGDKGDNGHIQKAVDELDKSLDPSLWVNGMTLDSKDGKKVFDHEKNAVKELLNVKHLDLSSYADELIAVDKGLAEVAVYDTQQALDSSTGDAKELSKAQDELSKAQDELSKAQGEIDAGHSDHAIDHYKNAWDHAQKAMDHVQKAGS